MRENICIKCIHKEVCYKYRIAYVGARKGTCTNFISNDAPILDEKSSELLMDIIEKDEVRCSCCGNFLNSNEGIIIAGRCRDYILCCDCSKRKAEFIKRSDEQ